MVFDNKIWRFFVFRNLDSIRLQAIYHALALAISKTPQINAILLTTTNKSSISCGYHQNFYEEVDLKYCKKHKIELIRRYTGGGLVLLEKDQVFYNLILNGLGFPSPIRNLYKIALKSPNQFLKSLKLNSKVDFNEILINDRKISGNGSAYVEKTGIIVGNILLDFNYSKFCNALNVPSANFKELTTEELEHNLTTLHKELKHPITTEETIEGLKSAFETNLKIKLVEDELTNLEFTLLEKIENQYKQKNWNFKEQEGKIKSRNFIKIKKGNCIVHITSINADFLISNAIIKKIKISDHLNDIKKLTGINIYKIKDKFPEFSNLQDIFINFFNRASV